MNTHRTQHTARNAHTTRVGGIRHGACLLGMPPMTTNVENRGGKEGTVITLRIRWFIGK